MAHDEESGPDAAPDRTIAVTDGDEDRDDEIAAADRPRVSGWRRLDATSILLCTLVALIAAVLAGVLVGHFVDDDDRADAGSGLQAAERAPSTEFERFDGSAVSLDDYRGQPLVVNFWGSWCAPCVKEMPDLQKIHTSLGEEVTILGVNVRDDLDDAVKMVDRTGVTYDLARDPEGALIRALDVARFPTTLLIQADGTIVDRVFARIRPERLCDKINQSLLAGALTKCG